METIERAIWQALQSIIAPFYRLSAHACQKVDNISPFIEFCRIDQRQGWLVGCEISIPFQHKTGYTGDKVWGGDLVPPC